MKIKKLVIPFFAIITGISVFTIFSLQIHNVDEVEAISQTGTYHNLDFGNESLIPRYSGPSDISIDGNIVLVSDSQNNRILLYDKDKLINEDNHNPYLVLGQPDTSYLNTYWGTTARSVTGNIPFVVSTQIRATIKSGKIIAVDYWENRVLIWNSIPTQNNAPADVVLGQPDFTSDTANNGGLGASSLDGPKGVYYDGVRLFVADTLNNRILIWSELPTTNNEPADYVLGQGDVFNTNTANKGGISANSLYMPYSVYSDGSRVYVVDIGNNRVLIYDGVPGEAGWDSTADYVLGQGGVFNTNTANKGGISANSLYMPYSVYSDGTRVYVADNSNHRVLIYNGVPGEAGWDSTADYVLGQGDDFSTNTANKGGISSNSIYMPSSVYSDGSRVYVADCYNHRVLIYSGVPGEVGWDSTADYVLGQNNDFTTGIANNSGINAGNLNLPWHLDVFGNKLLVADEKFNRVLIWNSMPSGDNTDSDVVLGQADHLVGSANRGLSSPTAGTLYSPSSVWTDGNKVLVSEFNNHRVLIWTEFPTTNGEDANLVLGQSLMTTRTSNNGGRSASSLYYPTQVYSDGTRVYVADNTNHRVLIWNEFPTTNKESADLVIGQPNFSSGTANNTGLVVGARLNRPYAVWSDGTKLIVGDYNNHRVLIWTEFPTTNGESADIVLGQPDMLGTSANNGGITASSLYCPAGLKVDSEGRLFVADSINNRVLIWNEFPTTNGEPADIVIGQTDFTSNTPGNGSIEFNEPRGIDVDEEGKRLYISDRGNNRVVVYQLEPQGVSITPVKEYTNSTIANLFNLASTDAKEMMVSLDSSFSGLSWEPFSTSKLIDLPVGDGLKSVFAKFRDFGNYESGVLSANIILDTMIYKPVITQLGLIKNMPNKDSLYYYFTANKVRIYGNAESNSTVQFERANGTKYTTQADSEGKFLIVIDLPNGETKLTYSSTDLAGNVSGSRTITFNIDPYYGTSTEGTQEETVITDEEEVAEETTTPTEQEDEAVKPVIKSLLVVDSLGNILTNTTIEIAGEKYTTDERGYIHTETQFSEEMIASIEGRKYTIDPANTYLTLTEAEEGNKKYNYLYLIIPIIVVIISIAAFLIRRKK